MKARPAFFLALSAAVAFALMPHDARAVEAIPFTDEDGLIAVQASVDGQPPAKMLVDLGAGMNILSERLGYLVPLSGKYTTLRLTGERVDLPMGKLVSLSVGGVPLEETTVGVWNGLSATRGVDGLISATAFRTVATTFDFHDRQIVIEDAVSFPERRRVATRVPLVLQDDLDTALALFARFDFGNGRTGLCEIDTGAKGIVLDNVFKKEGVTSLTMIGAPQTKVDRPSVTYGNLIYDCTIGNDFWGGRTFTIDILNRALWVAQQN
jgi:Aspartyl protease